MIKMLGKMMGKAIMILHESTHANNNKNRGRGGFIGRTLVRNGEHFG